MNTIICDVITDQDNVLRMATYAGILQRLTAPNDGCDSVAMGVRTNEFNCMFVNTLFGVNKVRQYVCFLIGRPDVSDDDATRTFERILLDMGAPEGVIENPKRETPEQLRSSIDNN